MDVISLMLTVVTNEIKPGYISLMATPVKHHKHQQGKSEGLDSCDRSSNLKLDSNRRLFSLCDLEI